ncbi:M15 family metallopeptidase [Myxococcus sp. RHSTA-1-4]|uniref:M15 family metallopeptidase n=1 Tax=Myxococcus sp. RHSTA-1-4 TaxID=2874601 RepID=UPI001CBE8C62|nr:M15 family metallopeptidase [Myxococcus sp. RHSTA-1-4]MBZ4416621.1 M15 family metallopeptidase [Myxococcus sp. RHSTA-1-4]
MSYGYQEPSYLCLTREAVRDIYKATRAPDELDGHDRFVRTTRVLGNPILTSFKTEQLVPVHLPGFGPQKNETRKVSVNRKLAHLFMAAFEKIKAAHLPYVLYDAGTYNFRYKQNTSVKQAIANLPEYAQLRQGSGFWGSWNSLCAEHDRLNNAFEEEVFCDGRMQKKKELLSNHSWGSAIDLNSTTNPYDKTQRFDMPIRIVEIMEGFGFHWGGYYHDYMHFEFARTQVSGASDEEPSQVVFPFGADPRRESPLKYYFFNEAGAGGFFPLGKQQNLHAGVHLEPDSPAPLVPVRAAMPGYIVAARLMAPGKEGDNEILLSATEGRPLGFVLVRHEFTEPEGTPPPKPFPLYSLYMHLAPPKWGGAESDKAFEKAPWLESFFRMQHGAVVNIDPDSDEVGKTYWAQGPLNPRAENHPVRDRAQPVPGIVGGRPLALAKPSPQEVTEAIEALKKGSIITFDRPLFPVAAGEIIGFLAPGRDVPSEELAPAQDSGASATLARSPRPPAATAPLPRYVHWELFSLSGGDSGLKFLIEKDEALKALLQEVEEQDKKDNFLQMPSDRTPGARNEVQDILGPTGVNIVKELRTARYGTRLRQHFNNGTRFFSAEDTTEKPFTWPLTITLENKYKFPGDPTTVCTLEVQYKKAGDFLSRERFTLSPKRDVPTLTVKLSVPAAADSLSLWSPVFFADRLEVAADVLREKRFQSRAELFKKAARHRWRNLVMNHINEWTPAGLVKQLEARKAEGFFDHLEDKPETTFEKLKEYLLPLTWWDRPATEKDPYGEVPVLADAQGHKKSLFGDSDAMLPRNANVVSMHPVTALWLVDLLVENAVIGLAKEWPPCTLKRDESTLKPPFLGLLFKGHTALSGKEMLTVLVQHGYGTTAGTSAEDVTFWLAAGGDGGAGSEPQVLCRTSYKDGVALGRARAPSWGQWEVYATRADGQRFEPLESRSTTFDVPKPVLTGQPFELGSKPGKLRPLAAGGIVVRQNLPATLPGYVVFEYWKLPPRTQPDLRETPTAASLAMPVLASRPPEARTTGGLRYLNDLIVGTEKKDGNPKVTPNFSFKEFLTSQRHGRVFQGDPATAFRLAVPLAQRLQELRDLCKPKNGEKELQLSVKRLAENGLSLLVTPNTGSAEDLTLLAKKLRMLSPSELHSAEYVEAEEAVRLTYSSANSSGVLHLEFDPAPALGRLAAELLSDETGGEVLHVRPRFIAPNSGHALHTSRRLTAVEGETELFSASAADIRAACGEDCLEVVADRCLPPVSRFEFGAIQVKMGAGVLRTEVKLHGDANAWKAAAPIIKLAGIVQNKRGNGVLLADWPLLDKNGHRIPQMWGDKLTFTAEVTQPGKVATPPPPVTCEVKVEPRLETLTWKLQGKNLCFTGQGHFIPTGLDFHIICDRQDATTGQWAEDATITSAIRYKLQAEFPWGQCTETGIFEASVPHLLLKKAEGPFRFYWRRRVNRAGAPLLVLGAVIEEPPPLEVTMAELGL